MNIKKNSGFNYIKTKKYSIQLYAVFIAVLILMSLTPVFADSGSIWTTNEDGTKQDGNVYPDPLSVYLDVNLENGEYYFQVTDIQGNLLSEDNIEERLFNVKDDEIVGGSHDIGAGVIQLWPFNVSESTMKVWVINVVDYDPDNSGFVPAHCKTDNFKVISVPKYFDLWVTEEMLFKIEGEAFFVEYAIDGDGDPNTNDPADLTVEELIPDPSQESDTFDVFRHQAFFPIGTYIYWSFSAISNGPQWTSELHGPELISEANMVNLEKIFWIDGFLTGEDIVGVPIELYQDDPALLTPPTTDPIAVPYSDENGYFAFIAVVPVDGLVKYTVFSEARNDNPEVWYWFYCPTEGVTDHTLEFNEYDVPEIQMKLKGQEITDTFEVVFTPAGEDLFKISSTNMGSFFLYVIKYGDPGSDVGMTILLPEYYYNNHYDHTFDYPNFALHSNKGNVDIHVYKGTYESKKGEITKDFNIYTDPLEYIDEYGDVIPIPYLPENYDEGKWVRVEGKIPYDSESVVVRVHLNYDLEPLTSWQVEAFYGTLSGEEPYNPINDPDLLYDEPFEYWFTVIHNPRGVRDARGVR